MLRYVNTIEYFEISVLVNKEINPEDMNDKAPNDDEIVPSLYQEKKSKTR